MAVQAAALAGDPAPGTLARFHGVIGTDDSAPVLLGDVSLVELVHHVLDESRRFSL